MFELSVALKYLIPRKKHISVTLIALTSTVVISLVVWLLLVFLSITEGMEKGWLAKLTKLNAPIKITPTPAYFSSYYYKIDSISSASSFSPKTLEEKQLAHFSDPYNPEEDEEIPSYWPKATTDAQGHFIDPVKRLTSLLKKKKGLFFQDYEMSGAQLKLQMLRNGAQTPFTTGQESLHFLTQIAYLATPPLHSKVIKSLLYPPSKQDISHLFFLAGYRMENILSDQSPEVLLAQETFQEKLSSLLKQIQITSLKTVLPEFTLPTSMLEENKTFVVHGLFSNGHLSQMVVPEKTSSLLPTSYIKGTMMRKGKQVVAYFDKVEISLPLNYPLHLLSPLIFRSILQEDKLSALTRVQDLPFLLQGSLQGYKVEGVMSWQGLEIDCFSLLPNEITPPWMYEKQDQEMALPIGDKREFGILLPKSLKEGHVLLGDKGFISYSSSTTSSIVEQRIPIFVAGFYDPGVLSIGNKCLLVPRAITRTINAANTSFTFDQIALNGFQVWFDDLTQVDHVKKELEDALKQENIHSYWTVSSFKEYDFAKDLLEQFKSDKHLFSLVGILILLVACCNIFSFLLLLVNDKKKEIAILQAMGATRKSIACIFGLCGMVVGALGCTIGTLAALLTLTNIDVLVKTLSAIQGHELFNQAFYGTTLPSTLSTGSLLFLGIATPILSLCAGLVPAIKACRLHPSSILRSNS